MSQAEQGVPEEGTVGSQHVTDTATHASGKTHLANDLGKIVYGKKMRCPCPVPGRGASIYIKG